MLHLVAAGAASRNETTASLPKALDQKWLERKREQKAAVPHCPELAHWTTSLPRGTLRTGSSSVLQ
jgi:hypothetical protein